MMRELTYSKMFLFVAVFCLSHLANSATTAYQVLRTSDRAQWVANQGGESTHFTVNYNVNNKGPGHVSGVLWTTNGWITSNTLVGAFQYFSGNTEIWQASIYIPGLVANVEYIVFCKDLSGNSAVYTPAFGWNYNGPVEIWDNNGGNRYIVNSSW